MHLGGRLNIFAPYLDAFLGADSIVYNEYCLPQHLLQVKPAPRYSRFSHGICVLLLIRPIESHFQACLPCNVRGRFKFIVIDLDEVEPGYFLRLPVDLFEVDSEIFNQPDWSLREVYVSNNTMDLSPPWRRFVAPSTPSTVRVNDEQILGSGFERIKAAASLETPYTTKRPHDVTRNNALDLFKIITELGEVDLFSLLRYRPGVLMYQNTSTEALFAIVLDFSRNRAAIVIPFESYMAFSSNCYDLRSVVWEDFFDPLISKRLDSGWRIFLKNTVTAAEILEVDIRTQPLTPLELSRDNRIKEGASIATPVRISLLGMAPEF
jgi:hypothetical protein